jgi:hypothetical protein
VHSIEKEIVIRKNGVAAHRVRSMCAVVMEGICFLLFAPLLALRIGPRADRDFTLPKVEFEV